MKTMLSLLILLLAFASPALAEPPAPPQEMGVSFGVFYSSLDPYGEWIQLQPDYYVWHPYGVARDWRPYFNGEWEWTPDGWYWVSDEPWAWAVYHYGRWYYDDYYGWVWTPGYDWAPAWVEWRYSGDVIGWAPLGPYAVFQVGFGIHYYHSWITPNSYWCFVGMRYMGGPRMYRHIYGVQYNHRYLGVTRSVEGIRYESNRIINRGPDRGFIEQRGGVRIRESRIVDVRDRGEQRVVRRGDQNEIRVYRPRGGEGVPGAGVARPPRLREADRAPSLDLRSTDLDRRAAVERQGRQAGEVRQAPRVTAPEPRRQPAAPERVMPRERSRVQQAPRSAQPEIRREAQPRRPAQNQPAVRPQVERRQERSVQRAEPQRAPRPAGQGTRRSEDRRERRGR